MPKVYVVQVGMQRRDTMTGDKIPFDLSPAEEFGQLVPILGPRATPYNAEAVIAEMKSQMRDFTENDYLLLVGNPCLIGWAVAIAASKSNTVQLLQWSGRERRYLRIRSPLNFSSGTP